MARYVFALVLLVLAPSALAQEPTGAMPTESALVNRFAGDLAALTSRHLFETAAASKSQRVYAELALRRYQARLACAATEFEAAIACAEVKMLDPLSQGGNLRYALQQDINQASSQWSQSVQQAYQEYSSSRGERWGGEDRWGGSGSALSSRESNLMQDLQRWLQNPELAKLAVQLQPALPDLVGGASTTLAAEKAADEAVSKAFSDLGGVAATEREQARQAVAAALAEYANDLSGLRSAVDEATRAMRLRVEEACAAAETACRLATVRLALGEVPAAP